MREPESSTDSTTPDRGLSREKPGLKRTHNELVPTNQRDLGRLEFRGELIRMREVRGEISVPGPRNDLAKIISIEPEKLKAELMTLGNMPFSNKKGGMVRTRPVPVGDRDIGE